MKINFGNFMLLFLAVALVYGCQTIPSENIEAQNVREKKFEENIQSVKTTTPEESNVVKILVTYKDAYNKSDADVIEGLLSKDFELRYIAVKWESSEQKDVVVSTQNRSEYLNRRLDWSSSAPRNEKLTINISGLKINDEGTEAVVTIKTTYTSKYFHPRFNEIIHVKNVDNKWLIEKIFVFPIEPKPNEVEISLISFGYMGKYMDYVYGVGGVTGLAKDIDKFGPDIIVKKYIELSCCLTEIPKNIFILFSEPPAEGSKIHIRMRGRGTDWMNPSTTTFNRKSPYTVFSGLIANGPNLWVEVEVYIDGILVGSEKLRS